MSTQIISHTEKGTTYVPLLWSAFLKKSAQDWADECARTGILDHSWHLNVGENIAMHEGNEDKSPSNILTRECTEIIEWSNC